MKRSKQPTAISTFSLPPNHAEINARIKPNYVSPELVLIIDSNAIPKELIPQKQPMMTNEGRIFLIHQGSIDANINMLRFHATAGQALFFPIGAIVEIEHFSADYRCQGFVFSNLSMPDSLRQPMLIDIAPAKQQRLEGYLHLLQLLSEETTLNIDAIRYVQQAFFADLAIAAAQMQAHQQHIQGDYRERLFVRFLELLNQHCATEHGISFYANQLCLSPNRLSAVIKEYSGRTVMQWLNHRLTLQAKVMLADNNLSIGDIAFALGFEELNTFSRFFKRETGFAPTEYRKSK